MNGEYIIAENTTDVLLRELIQVIKEQNELNRVNNTMLVRRLKGIESPAE